MSSTQLSDVPVTGKGAVVTAQEHDTDAGYPEGGTRAWMVAAGNGAVLCATLGFVNSYGIFQSYYERHQLSTINPSTIAWIGSLQAFFIFAFGAIGGPLFDRYGSLVIYPSALSYIVGLMLTSISTKYWHLLLAQGLLSGISCGLLMTPAMAATPQYFDKKRDIAMGLAVSMSSIGGVVFPVMIGRMLQNDGLGFGWSVRIAAFVCLALLVFASISIKPRLPPRKSQFFKPQAFLDPVFALICFSAVLLFLAFFQPFFFVPSYALTQGMSESMAFYLVPILNGASFPGRIIAALSAKKYGRFNVLLAACISSGILAFCWTQTHTNATIILWAVLYGFCSGAVISVMSVAFASATKDPKDLGTYIGMGLTTASVGAVIGPPISGALYSHYQGFEQVAIMTGVLLVAGGFLMVPIKMLSGHAMLSRN